MLMAEFNKTKSQEQSQTTAQEQVRYNADVRIMISTTTNL